VEQNTSSEDEYFHRYSRQFHHFIKFENLVLSSQERATSPFLEPDTSNPHIFGLDHPGFDSLYVYEISFSPQRPALFLGAPRLLFNGYRVSFSKNKEAGAWI
jgi:hypothetical protein